MKCPNYIVMICTNILQSLCFVFRKGNKASVWEMLIKEKKLPYMAMVRNIRNMIMAGINDEVVKLAIHYLTNEKAVVKSRMFPYRFYTAYDVLDELKNFKEKNFQVYDKNYTKNPTKEELKKVEGLKKKFEELKKKQKTMNDKSIDDFKAALDKAVEIATNQNIPPIKGVTIILLKLTNALNEKDRKFMTDVLFALMLLKSCENAKLFVAPPYNSSQFKEMRLKMGENSLLSLVKEIEKIKETNSLLLTFKNVTTDNKVDIRENTFCPADLIR